MGDPVNILLENFMSVVIFGLFILFFLIPFVLNPKAAEAFTARGKVDELAGKIDDVCLTGEPREVKKFSLPQKERAEQITAAQEFIVKISGDPEYVLYYEAFPPGEALGWELYHRDFGYRLMVPYKGPDIDMEKNPDELFTFVEDAKKKASAFRKDEELKENADMQEKLGKKSLGAVVTNIILNGKLDFFTGKPVAEGKTEWGEWKDFGANAESFGVSNYAGVGNFEKTAIKHMICEDNSLCLKTRQGVVAYKLPNCAANGFDFIVLKGKMREIPGAPSKGGEMPAFQIASPCTGDLKISVLENCKDEFNEELKCSKGGYFEKTPVYRVDANKLVKTGGDHWSCVMGNRNDNKPATPESPGKCIQIEIENKDDYCYTNYEVPSDWWKEAVTLGILGGEPIKDLRYYMPDTSPLIPNTGSFLLRPNLLIDVPTFDLIAGWVWP